VGFGDAASSRVKCANVVVAEIMDLRREAESKGMSSDEAKRWAAAEFRRRHPKE